MLRPSPRALCLAPSRQLAHLIQTVFVTSSLRLGVVLTRSPAESCSSPADVHAGFFLTPVSCVYWVRAVTFGRFVFKLQFSVGL